MTKLKNSCACNVKMEQSLQVINIHAFQDADVVKKDGLTAKTQRNVLRLQHVVRLGTDAETANL
jgi:hypothetical protein